MAVETLSVDEKLDPALEGLEPKSVWYYLNQIRQIPRNSGKEQRINRFILDWAVEHGFETKEDATGNIAIHVPGQGTRTVICQGHSDMVCVKAPGSTHNFDTDPIRFARHDEAYDEIDSLFIKAVDTTSGVDNGGGLAQFMAAAVEPGVVRPPMIIVVTVEEESTLRGAEELDPHALKLTEASVIINLDTSRFKILCVGCAGINPVEATLPVLRDSAELMQQGTFYEVDVKGYPGGHSGDDAGKENPIFFLRKILRFFPAGARMATITGGEKRNLIPTDASAIFYVPHAADAPHDVAMWQEAADALVTAKRTELGRPEITCTIRAMEGQKMLVPAMTMETHDRVMGTLDALPDGILRRSTEVPDQVETSSNLGIVRTDAGSLKMNILVRGSVTDEMSQVARSTGKILSDHGFQVTVDEPLPSWQGDPTSPLVHLAQDAHRHVTGGQEPEIRTMHSFIEPGAVTHRLPQKGVQAISMGPTNLDEHVYSGKDRVGERVGVRSMELSYQRFLYMLKGIAEGALEKESRVP